MLKACRPSISNVGVLYCNHTVQQKVEMGKWWQDRSAS